MPAEAIDFQADVLAIAAHRDDVEQTCGGTLLRMAARGLRTAILDTSQKAKPARAALRQTVLAKPKKLHAFLASAGGRHSTCLTVQWPTRLKIARPSFASFDGFALVSSSFPTGMPATPTTPSLQASALKPASSPVSRSWTLAQNRIVPSRSSMPAFTPMSAPQLHHRHHTLH